MYGHWIKRILFLELAHVWDIVCRLISVTRAENNCIQWNQHYVTKKLIAGKFREWPLPFIPVSFVLRFDIWEFKD